MVFMLCFDVMEHNFHHIKTYYKNHLFWNDEKIMFFIIFFENMCSRKNQMIKLLMLFSCVVFIFELIYLQPALFLVFSHLVVFFLFFLVGACGETVVLLDHTSKFIIYSTLLLSFLTRARELMRVKSSQINYKFWFLT